MFIANNGVDKYIILRFLLSGMLEIENYIGNLVALSYIFAYNLG